MNEYRQDKPCCYFHPKEVIIGVCPLCLNEKLLILAAKQGHRSQPLHQSHSSNSSSVKHRKLPKIFDFGSLLNRKQFDNSHSVASTSPEDSFISIKFGENGAASWEKSTVSRVSLDHCNISSWNHSLSKENTTKKSVSVVVEHAKPPQGGELRWRKRIGHLFQLSRWKRSSKASVCHVGSKLEGVKVTSGWIRTLTTTKRTKE
ncbi:uncharacterized protein LOC114270656 [Camellia sinensis]|uniref:Uncharacterized protein n=1 Tax=Camellia sinensis var. sinensis TaxID=542762 RepID=A0A4S4EM80_CAMSN|nr:uncharacterized protein LOC114270656 [Camellia sinensis]THG17255.1 hypothetical protein TEA_015011 [Camellia sinensis var. sinensis]